jgi:transposase
MDAGSALLAFRRNLFGYRMGRISAPVVNLSSMSAKQVRNTAAVLREIARVKARFGVPESAGVFSCYEAGRDGFWLRRCLHHHGINNVIVDSSSIEVNRRARRAKADGLDAVSLVGLLARYGQGETNVCDCFGSLRDLGGHRIQINVDTDRQPRFFVENRHALEAPLEKK